MGKLKNLKEGYKEHLESAKILEDQGNYKSAVELYFKAMTSLTDHIIKKETNRTPKNHSERFRITENKFPEIYKILDSVFSTYRKAYTQKRGEKHVRKIKKGIQRIIRTQGNEEKFKTPN